MVSLQSSGLFVQLALLCVCAWGIFLLSLKGTNLKWKTRDLGWFAVQRANLIDVSSLFWRQENHSSWSLQNLNEFASSKLLSLFKNDRISTVQLSSVQVLWLIILIFWQFTMCKFLNPKFHSQWSRHQLHEICSKWSKTSKRQRFWCLKGRGAPSRQHLTTTETNTKLTEISEQKATVVGTGSSIVEESLLSFAFLLKSRIFLAWNLCVFSLHFQKCRHWILVEDYGMHVCIYIYLYIPNYIFKCIFVWKHIKKHTLCIFIYVYRLLRMSNT